MRVPGESSLDIQQEAALLAEAAGRTRVELATASNFARLLSTALEDHPILLHLSLHCGDGGQYLLFEDEHGGAHPVSLKELRGMLAATGGAERLGLVFLHACCSDLAGQVFIEAGAQHVICCRGNVFDATARCFTRAFYTALCVGSKSLGQAFDIAKYEIRMIPQVGLRGEGEKYVRGPQWEPSHSVARLDLPVGSSLAPSPFAACSAALPSRVEDFGGRARDLWLLMQHIGSSRRCVTVCGPEQCRQPRQANGAGLGRHPARRHHPAGDRQPREPHAVGLGRQPDQWRLPAGDRQPEPSLGGSQLSGAMPPEIGRLASLAGRGRPRAGHDGGRRLPLRGAHRCRVRRVRPSTDATPSLAR
jgi:hypothetical protein